jgi:hypothetical protein
VQVNVIIFLYSVLTLFHEGQLGTCDLYRRKVPQHQEAMQRGDRRKP